MVTPHGMGPFLSSGQSFGLRRCDVKQRPATLTHHPDAGRDPSRGGPAYLRYWEMAPDFRRGEWFDVGADGRLKYRPIGLRPKPAEPRLSGRAVFCVAIWRASGGLRYRCVLGVWRRLCFRSDGSAYLNQAHVPKNQIVLFPKLLIPAR